MIMIPQMLFMSMSVFFTVMGMAIITSGVWMGPVSPVFMGIVSVVAGMFFVAEYNASLLDYWTSRRDIFPKNGPKILWARITDDDMLVKHPRTNNGVMIPKGSWIGVGDLDGYTRYTPITWEGSVYLSPKAIDLPNYQAEEIARIRTEMDAANREAQSQE